MRRVIVLLVVSATALVALARAPVRAQSASADAFAVVSIKPNVSGNEGGGGGFQPGGRFRGLNISAQSLITIAFSTPGQGLLHAQIVGGPNWLASDRFDIDARADSALPSDVQSLSTHMSAMLRTLLDDRFKLKMHRETRQEQIYALVKARPDGPLGPGLRASSIDCLALRQQRRDNPSTAPALPSACTNGVEFGQGVLSGSNVQISNLAPTLSGAVERVVVDRTGLTGNFDIDLHWTAGGVPADPTSDALSIFTAVQEQLGLKLESTTGPVDVLVIDHIEPPTAD